MAQDLKKLTKSEIKAVALNCLRNPVLFCKTFLPHWFSGRVPWVHKGMLAIIIGRSDFLDDLPASEKKKILKHFVYRINPADDRSEVLPIFRYDENGHIQMKHFTKVVMLLPRGYAKTTIINAANIYFICYQIVAFPLYLSESATHSSTQLRNIKAELEDNERIIHVFGNLVPDRQDSRKWTDDIIELTNGAVVVARGRGGQVRGANVRAQRPDILIIDDVEDEESVRSEEQRKKTREWFFNAVLPAVARVGEVKARVFVAGTRLHPESLIEIIAKDPKAACIIFGARDLDGDLLWPENMDEEDLEAEKTTYALAGNLSGFYREFFNQFRNEETAKFRPDFIRYLPPGEQLPPLVATALACDPAISPRKEADFCAFGVTGISRDGLIYILDVHEEQGMLPRQQIDKFFELQARWNTTRQGVESTAYQQALVFLIQEEMFRKGRYFEVTPIKHGRQAKIERVEGILQPRYAAGYIIHRTHFPVYEKQLLDWPYGKKDDPDVIAMSIGLLLPFAAAAIDPTIDLARDEYKPLETAIGEWRSCP